MTLLQDLHESCIRCLVVGHRFINISHLFVVTGYFYFHSGAVTVTFPHCVRATPPFSPWPRHGGMWWQRQQPRCACGPWGARLNGLDCLSVRSWVRTLLGTSQRSRRNHIRSVCMSILQACDFGTMSKIKWVIVQYDTYICDFFLPRPWGAKNSQVITKWTKADRLGFEVNPRARKWEAEKSEGWLV